MNAPTTAALDIDARASLQARDDGRAHVQLTLDLEAAGRVAPDPQAAPVHRLRRLTFAYGTSWPGGVRVGDARDAQRARARAS